jgi:hypothetical protein
MDVQNLRDSHLVGINSSGNLGVGSAEAALCCSDNPNIAHLKPRQISGGMRKMRSSSIHGRGLD